MTSTYPAPQPPAGPGGVVTGVEPGSAAARAGLRVGDTIAAADGEPLRDIIDWQWAASDFAVRVTARSEDGSERELTLERSMDEPFGVSFQGVVFDGIRECDNACAFCFVSQLPKGLREALYVRDDDYRLSFLFGNFVSLTNLTDDDVSRIMRQRLSPLYVSLHAIDPSVRRRLICATGEDSAIERLDALLDAGIEVHVQIVLVPGVNDEDVLDDTLRWLGERPGVLSVGVVPLGYTDHQSRYRQSYGDAEAARRVLSQIERVQTSALPERGSRWVWPADEFYLSAGSPVPAWDDYEDFPQYENGIGLVRAFIDELDTALVEGTGSPNAAEDVPDDHGSQPSRTATGPEARPGTPDAGRPLTLVTGEMFAPVLERVVTRIAPAARVLAVHNGLFGGNVAVTGLLAGRDIVDAIRRDGAVGTYLVPEVVVNSDGLMLDDVRPSDLSRLSGADVHLVPTDAQGLVESIRHMQTGTESKEV